jgi:hypothetical protein
VRGRLGAGGRQAPGVALEQPDKAFGEHAFLGGGETVGAHIKTVDAAPGETSKEDAAPLVDLREELLQWNTWPGLLRARSASAA